MQSKLISIICLISYELGFRVNKWFFDDLWIESMNSYIFGIVDHSICVLLSMSL